MRVDFNVIKPQSNFTIVANGFIRNPKLSLKAKALYIHLLSLPDNATATLRSLAACHVDGKSSVSRCAEELSASGHLRVDSGNTKEGKYWSTWTLMDPETGPDSGTTSSFTGPDSGTGLSHIGPKLSHGGTKTGPDSGTHIKTNDLKTEDKQEDTPLPPKGGDTVPERQASKPSQKAEASDAELESCITELPELWNAAAKMWGLLKSVADRTAMIRQLWKESALFREHWREIGPIFAADKWNLGVNSRKWKANLDYALRPKTAQNPRPKFETAYECYLETGPPRDVQEETTVNGRYF
jgi:hypothetical protein